MISFLEIYLLGAIAGFTIFLGLPLVFLPQVSAKLRGFLNSVSIGVLIFLLVEVMSHTFESGEEAVIAGIGAVNMGPAIILLALIVMGFVLGLTGLNIYENNFIKKKNDNPGAEHFALMIAIGIGLHNLSEGLAIGQSFTQGQISLALLLVVGFGLHNMTEGFGVAGPIAGKKPNIGFVILLGLIAGGPTFLGTILGSMYSSPILNTFILALAGGAIMYVVKELLFHGRIKGEEVLLSLGIAFGLFLGYGTEMILGVAGF